MFHVALRGWGLDARRLDGVRVVRNGFRAGVSLPNPSVRCHRGMYIGGT